MPVSGHKDSGTCVDGGQEVGSSSSSHCSTLTGNINPTVNNQHQESCTVCWPPFCFLQGLYQFLCLPSSSPPLPRSSPVSMDYSTFGTAACPAIIPDDSDPARWACSAPFTLLVLLTRYCKLSCWWFSLLLSILPIYLSTCITPFHPLLFPVLLSSTCNLSAVKLANQCLAAVWLCSPQGAAVC